MKEEFMDVAIDLSDDNFEKNYGGPFGAVVVKNGKIIGRGINRVLKNNDPTAHAEIIAIRRACSKLETYDLSDCELYTSCYPCPMCLSAIIWSNIKTVYYANTKEDAADIGFRDDMIYDYFKALSEGTVKRSILNLKAMNNEEAKEVFDRFKEDEDKVIY
ncbi:MAG: nucleoside deaminase [Bacilli bacterium]|nr:nucleoside deaminase [Bacilli bacterium]